MSVEHARAFAKRGEASGVEDVGSSSLGGARTQHEIPSWQLWHFRRVANVFFRRKGWVPPNKRRRLP